MRSMGTNQGLNEANEQKKEAEEPKRNAEREKEKHVKAEDIKRHRR